LLYNNKSIQVANLAIRDAWFAGGIEWNIGQYGHSFTTSTSVFSSIQQDSDEQDFLRIYDYERCKELWWHIDFHLPKDSPMLYAHVSIHNLNDKKTSLYYWTNTAVPVDDNTRIFASSDEALYLDPYALDGRKEYGFMKAPRMDIQKGIDTSYPNQFPNSNEYFFTCEKDAMPWEASIDKEGKGFFEVSTKTLAYRKMFCWGTHAGGKRWQRYLSPETDGEYIELQSGLSPSQLHGMFLEGNSSISWTQSFGAIEVNPLKGHSASFSIAKEEITQQVLKRINVTHIETMNDKYKKMALIPPSKIINRGSGWGYIEKEVRKITLPQAFLFDENVHSHDEKIYLAFIKTLTLPVMDPFTLPLIHPTCNEYWKEMFVKALAASHLSKKERATINHYLGIIYMEMDELSLAQTSWSEVMGSLANAWTARNLAQLSKRWNYMADCLSYYEKATTLPGFFVDVAIAEEYLTLLISQRNRERAASLFDSLPSNWLKTSEKLRMLRAQLASLQEDAPLIKKLVFDTELAHIKEGDTPLNELWISYNAINYAKEHNIKVTKEVQDKVKKIYPIPSYLDFNMFS
ncbi:MAG: DUF5107 domain-containing protein, partial [Spirochaetia bacterium]|nr:DUF5107 domain-containing protein [Spirochaetia bacterium]